MIRWIWKIPSNVGRRLGMGGAAGAERRITWRGMVAGGALLLGLASVGGALLVISGVVPIHASSGHAGITRQVLHFAKERSISTYSVGKSVPPLDDPDMILRGAAHYEIGCRSCHGSPALGSSRIAQRMLPEPPYLPDIIGKRQPAELFQVVKHGIKFTGMPAWPAADRDDEVWAMVAFLKKMPELDAGRYLQLARGDAITAQERPSRIPDRVARSCARCHGEDGIARGSGAFPHLAGQRVGYLRNSLAAYASGHRQSGTMGPVAAELSESEVEELARYYAALPPPGPPAAKSAEADADAIRRGAAIAMRGSLEDRLPSCNDCHAPDGRRINDSYPSLGGQPADFLVLQLELFKAKARGGTGFSHLMHPTADRLDDGQIRDLALYYESLSSK